MRKDWEVGEYFIYKRDSRLELGKIKSIAHDGVFAYYHSGETAAKTPFYLMHKIQNQHFILDTELGGRE